MKYILFFLVGCFCYIEAAIPEPIIKNIEFMLSNEKKISIIAIAGCPGVGKSTFANLLLQELAQKNIKSVVLGFDNFGKTLEEKKVLRNELDIRRIHWEDLHSVLKEIKLGKKKIKIPKIDQLTKDRTEEILDFNEIDIILFEGMYTLSDNELINLRFYADLGIYLETTTENICKWKWEREKKKTTPRTIEQFEDHMALIFEDFIRFVFPTKQNANWVVFVDDQHDFIIKKSF